MKCPLLKRTVRKDENVNEEDFLDCIGPECPAYVPAPKYDKILNPDLQPKEDCRMMRK